LQRQPCILKSLLAHFITDMVLLWHDGASCKQESTCSSWGAWAHVHPCCREERSFNKTHRILTTLSHPLAIIPEWHGCLRFSSMIRGDVLALEIVVLLLNLIPIESICVRHHSGWSKPVIVSLPKGVVPNLLWDNVLSVKVWSFNRFFFNCSIYIHSSLVDDARPLVNVKSFGVVHLINLLVKFMIDLDLDGVLTFLHFSCCVVLVFVTLFSFR